MDKKQKKDLIEGCYHEMGHIIAAMTLFPNDKRIKGNFLINVFSKNLENLLLTPPMKEKNVLGFDPAYRTGCKIAVIDETGKVLDTNTIYPTAPQNDVEGAKKVLGLAIMVALINLILIFTLNSGFLGTIINYLTKGGNIALISLSSLFISK